MLNVEITEITKNSGYKNNPNCELADFTCPICGKKCYVFNNIGISKTDATDYYCDNHGKMTQFWMSGKITFETRVELVFNKTKDLERFSIFKDSDKKISTLIKAIINAKGVQDT
jgi:hypothetical protein